MEIKFPHVKVQLTDQDGNAFAVMGAVIGAMRRAKVSNADIALYKAEAMSGDYDHLLRVSMATVDAS